MFENQHIPVYIGNILESLIGIKSAAKIIKHNPYRAIRFVKVTIDVVKQVQ